MTETIHQLLSVFDPADAQGQMALLLRKIFSDWGYDSEIFTGLNAPGIEIKAQLAENLPENNNPDDILLYHASINSDVGEIFRRSRGKQVLIYHNITPADYFLGYDLFTYLECRKGRRDLGKFIPTCNLALADSTFNADELKSLGFPQVELLPFPFDQSSLDGPADPTITRRYSGDNRPTILFVGRLAPNKKQEDILSVFYYFQTIYQPGARLVLVGPDNIPEYSNSLRQRVGELGLKDVAITGKVSPEELRAYYQSADIFLCLSEHEGFCVPLLESLYYQIPVVAYAAGAVPETLDGSGVLIHRKNPLQIATLLNHILTDSDLNAKLIRGQDQRLKQAINFNYEEALRIQLLTPPL
jgi:glycosyltransferase involved in cell wall biosynthesis